MIAYNITWDIDPDEYDAEEIKDIQFSMPDEVQIPRNIRPEHVADYLSDEYEFCAIDFQLR